MVSPKEPFLVRLVRGEATGPVPSILRLCLTPLSLLFAAVAEARILLYRLGVFTRHRVPCPVVSVGNLTVGGTGKTPLVEWVLKEIRLLGLNPVVLTRGYGARADEVPDELKVLAANLPGLHAVRDPDRVRGALKAIEMLCADALVLDDGFQHLRLSRALDIGGGGRHRALWRRALPAARDVAGAAARPASRAGRRDHAV